MGCLMTINPAELFLQRAHEVPFKAAIIDENITMSFRDVAHIVLSIADNMRSRGIGQGAIVAVHTNDSLVIICSTFACALLGASWVFGDDALANNRDIVPSHRLYTREVKSEGFEPSAMLVDEYWFKPKSENFWSSGSVFPGFSSSNDCWLFFHSSGTTGTPKFMKLTCETQLKRILALNTEFVAGESRCVFLFSAPSPPSLMRSLAALCWGGGLVISTDPHFWSESNTTHVFASPQQIKYVMSGHSLSKKIGKALIGGDGLPDELSKSLLENFHRVVNTYGSTETNLVVENEKLLNSDGSVTSRTIWYDSEIQIVDEDDRPLPAGEEGIVRIRNDYTVEGYVGVEPTRQSATRQGWFYPGDTGYVSEDRNFFVSGRHNDRLIVGGVKINAVLLDYVISSVDGVEDSITFQLEHTGGEHELIAFIKIREDAIHSDVQSDAKIKIAASLGISAIPSKFIFTNEIPRTENGKPNRRACAQLAMQARRERGINFI